MLCHTGTTVDLGMASGHLIIHLPVMIHLMEGPFMGPSSGQAVEDFHGVAAVAGHSAAGEGFAGGSSKDRCMGAIDGTRGIGQNLLWRLTHDRSPSPVILTNRFKRW